MKLCLYNNFMKKIIQIEYNGSPRFFFDKMSLFNKVNFYLKKFQDHYSCKPNDKIEYSLNFEYCPKRLPYAI